MFLGLLNASARRLLRDLLKSSLVYRSLTQGEHTFRGGMIEKLEKLDKLITESDIFYDGLYARISSPLPKRFHIPSIDVVKTELRNTNGNDFLYFFINFAKQLNRYLKIHDEAFLISSRDSPEIYQNIEREHIKSASRLSLKMVIDTFSSYSKARKWIVSTLSTEADIVVHTLYLSDSQS